MNLFITGTDTEVGKTYVTGLICKALAKRGERVAPFKPISCGDREDAQRLLAACGREDLTLDEVNPIHLKTPASPLAASMIEKREINIDALAEQAKALEKSSDHVIMEGVGGWEVPITPDQSLADLVAKLDYPVVVVVNNKLGAINHTILTVRSIEIFELACLGLVLNSTADERDAASISNRVVLETFLGSPILAEILHDQDELDLTPFLEAWRLIEFKFHVKQRIWFLPRRWRSARLRLMPKGERKVEIYCPKCGWHPREHDRWCCCGCYFAWNTFDTGGACPECGRVHEETQCPSCHAWSPHREWYHEFGFDEENAEETKSEPAEVTA